MAQTASQLENAKRASTLKSDKSPTNSDAWISAYEALDVLGSLSTQRPDLARSSRTATSWTRKAVLNAQLDITTVLLVQSASFRVNVRESGKTLLGPHQLQIAFRWPRKKLIFLTSLMSNAAL